jgi:phosphatidylglycerophosphatase A
VILYFVWPPQWYVQFLIILAVYLIGVEIGTRAETHLGHDARVIVIDEVAGQMTALFMAPRMIVPFALGFLLFRLFDIIKPPPARQWESHRGGRGVMNDDIAAGVYAAVTMQFLLALMDNWGVRYV